MNRKSLFGLLLILAISLAACAYPAGLPAGNAASHTVDAFSLSKLAGAPVKLASGEDAAPLAQVIVDGAGKVQYLLLDDGDRRVPVPWSRVKPIRAKQDGKETDSLSLAATADDLKKAPGYDSAADSHWDQEAHSYWDRVKTGGLPTSGNTATSTGSPSVLPVQGGSAVLYDAQGNPLGKIVDFILDGSTGQISYAVFTDGQKLGQGLKYVLLPVKWLRFDPNGKVSLTVDPSQLASAPAYSGWNQTPAQTQQVTNETDQFFNKHKEDNGKNGGKHKGGKGGD